MAGFELTNLGSSDKHANYYTNEATKRVKLILCLITHGIIKIYLWNGGIVPCILKP
jgi:hypothetical protein